MPSKKKNRIIDRERENDKPLDFEVHCFQTKPDLYLTVIRGTVLSTDQRNGSTEIAHVVDRHHPGPHHGDYVPLRVPSHPIELLFSCLFSCL
jgi:hypothetical protein